VSSTIPPDPGSEPEFLGQGSPEPSPRRSRTKVLVLAGVGVVAAGAVGVGAWGVAQLMGGGPGAAAVLPDTTVAYAALDLDPSAGQKIEAIKTLQKFPAIADELDLGSRDDIRRWFVDKLGDDGESCKLDYSADVEPWLGDKAAVAAVQDGDEGLAPVVVVQVKDQGDAEKGIDKIFSECSPSDDFGVSFLEGYAVIAQTSKIATAATEAAAKASLADDATYQSMLDALGEQGVATFYLAPGAPRAFGERAMGIMDSSAGWCAETPGEDEDPRDFQERCLTESTNEPHPSALDSFKGGAGTIRFEDGGIELAMVGSGIPALDDAGSADPSTVGDLPTSTIAALGLSLADGWTNGLEQQVRQGMGGWYFDMLASDFEEDSGLRFPEDLEALLGDGFVIALDGGTDFEALAEAPTPAGLKAGVRIDGDEAEVRRVVHGILRYAGASSDDLDLLKVRSTAGRVAIGFDEAYLDELLAGGDLGQDGRFSDAVVHSDEAIGAFFVDFDADDWLVRLADEVGGEDAVANVTPLDALGVSAWVEGDTSHAVVRLSTD
jgi:hypothetical protein